MQSVTHGSCLAAMSRGVAEEAWGVSHRWPPLHFHLESAPSNRLQPFFMTMFIAFPAVFNYHFQHVRECFHAKEEDFVTMHFTRATLYVLTMVLASVGPVAAKGPPSGGGTSTNPVPNPRAVQTFPIQLGTSGGWVRDSANGYCCGGTLGALVEDGEGQYILSNFHVLAADRVIGNNGYTADIDDAIVIQPALIDIGCNTNNGQPVAILEGYADPIGGANVDAAIARVVPGAVDPSGAILGIGPLAPNTVAAKVRQSVKKMGRTTGLTSSQVSGLNATVTITYDTECAGAPRGTATFTGQIIIANKGSKFLNSGDSGSLMVENVTDRRPSAVGLLFAGSSTVAIANPINDVLSALGVAMVGGAIPAGAAVPEAIDPGAGAAAAAQARWARLLESAPNAVGHAISQNDTGKWILKVYVEKDAPGARAALPSRAGGYPIVVEETGKLVAF